MLAPTETPRVAVKRTGPEDDTPFANEHGRRCGFFSLNVGRTRDVISPPPAEHDEQDGVGRNWSGKERGGINAVNVVKGIEMRPRGRDWSD